jgi:hypothetical protein
MIGLGGSPLRESNGHVNAIVETPRHSQVKFSYDATTGHFLAKKRLQVGYTWLHPSRPSPMRVERFWLAARTIDGYRMTNDCIATEILVPVRCVPGRRREDVPRPSPASP